MTASSSVVEELDLEHVLRHVVDTAVSLVDAQYGALGIVDSDGRLERFIHVGMPEQVAQEIGSLPRGHGLLGAELYQDGPIRIDHLGADPRSIGFPERHPPMDAFLGVPIRIRGETYGNLYLTNRADGPFTEEDEELVAALASTAATAITNARLYLAAQNAQRMSATLTEVSGELLASSGKDAFGVVADHVSDLIEADLVSIVVPGREAGEFRVETARGDQAPSVRGMRLPSEDRGHTRGDTGSDEGREHEARGRPPFEEPLRGGATLAAPFVISGETLGFLCASRRAHGPSFTAQDFDTLSEFAEKVGITVALAWARADRQRLDVVEDRARMARDLHDHVIQRLFGMGLGLQALAATEPAHAETLDMHVAQIDAAIADIRTAIFSLNVDDSFESVRHRLMDVAAELTPALNYSPRVTFGGPVDLIVIGQLADDVVAVVRESLTNVARHSRATTALVSVDVTDALVRVQVVDDGVGLPSGPVRASGTANLLVRARAHSGEFTLTNRSSHGARACWQVPLPSVLEETT
ncbi:sensor histidine kinase [Nesterenkonia lutea]|uniref:Signal transduction histidine kinase n=1 Tax=Nesterenkonia lutea TaxID=272919 RepID=A0ABR9JHL1_9MICC|nr:GAF domain-containing protein [Nesterenkonia lutea]MBE1524982.1 signal transduction histidine kinase [Nesterenkonia lutea]